MVAWAGDGTLAGYDETSHSLLPARYTLGQFTPGTTDANAIGRFGWWVPSVAGDDPRINSWDAEAPITITSGDLTANGITTGNGKGIVMTMISVEDSFFPPGTVPTPVQIHMQKQQGNALVTRSTMFYNTPGTRTFEIPAPTSRQQGKKYWVMLMPQVYHGGSAMTDTPMFSENINDIGKAISVWTNRTPTAPVITSPVQNEVVAPGDTFTIVYNPGDPDTVVPDDAEKYNRDLAGVEFQYAPQATPENPNPEWSPLMFRNTAADPFFAQSSWHIKGTNDYGHYDFLRTDLGGDVICGIEYEFESDIPYETAVLPSGNWQIRCRTFDYGHPYPAVIRPLGPADHQPGFTPQTYTVQNTSPWSTPVSVSIPAQVPPPLPLAPKDNIATVTGEVVRFSWQYRNSFVPPFPQARRTLQIREVGTPIWHTVFDGVSGNSYQDMPPEQEATPGGNREYLSDGGFEGGTADGWVAKMLAGVGSADQSVINQNIALNAHSGTRYLKLNYTGGTGVPFYSRTLDLHPEDTEFQFTGYVWPSNGCTNLDVTLNWLDEDGDPIALAGPDTAVFTATRPGATWTNWVHIETGHPSEPPGLVQRPGGAVQVEIIVMGSGTPLGWTVNDRLDDVSFIGASSATDAFTLEESKWYEWRVRTMDTDGEESNYSEVARFWVVPVPDSGAIRPGPADEIDGATLGCGTHRAEIYRRGGTVRVGEIKGLTHVDWSRVRDDISTAQIQVMDWDIDCGNLLASLQTWAYELVLWRNNGFSEERVWEGPITLLTYEHDKVTIDAKDVLGYAYRRIIRQRMTDTANGATVVDRARRVLQNAFAPDDPNVLAYLTVLARDDDAMQYRSTPAYSRTAFEEIDDMAANAGLDYTAVGRKVIVWGTRHRIGTLPEFRDKDLGEKPIVSEYGMSAANVYAVSDGNGVYGVATRGGIEESGGLVSGNDPTYGLVEMLSSTWASDSTEDSGTYTQAGLQTMIESFTNFAERSIADRYTPPVVVRIPDNTSINPDTVISIQDLVPGVVIPLRSTGTLRTVVGSQKLDSVKVTEDNGKEVVSITMSAFSRDDANLDDEVGTGDGFGGGGEEEGPGMLRASGAFTDNSSGATVVGATPLSDESDATYIESAEGQFAYTVALEPMDVGDFVPGGVEGGINLHMRLSCTGDGADPGEAEIFIATDAAGMNEIASFSLGAGGGFRFDFSLVDGTIQDVVVPLRMAAWSPNTVADVVAALEAGAYLDFNHIDNPDWVTPPTIRVYRAYISYERA